MDYFAPVLSPDPHSFAAEYPQEPFSDADLSVGEKYLSEWRRKKETRHAVREDKNEVHRMREFAEGARPVLLLALQDDNDMCVYPHLPKIFDGSYQAWVSAILESVPKEWKVIVKKHPLASFAVDSKNPNHFFADRVKLQSAMEMSDVVLSLSSLVCLEAAFGGKAAIVCGRPYYAGKGITLDMSAEGQTGVLPEFLRKAREFVPPERKLFMFAKRLFEDYQIDGNDGDKFRQLIANAMERKPQITDNLSRPFF